MKKYFYSYVFNNQPVIFFHDAIIELQLGKGKSSYKTKYQFNAAEFDRAVFHYNAINIGNGYKKRLLCRTINKPILARSISF